MNHISGRDLYGGSASSHWFECPNGHPTLSANAQALCKLACVLNAESLLEVPVIGFSLPTGRAGALSLVQCKSDPDECPGCVLYDHPRATWYGKPSYMEG
jgi:hypothetical protein